jgi:hypothetical protein
MVVAVVVAHFKNIYLSYQGEGFESNQLLTLGERKYTE